MTGHNQGSTWEPRTGPCSDFSVWLGGRQGDSSQFWTHVAVIELSYRKGHGYKCDSIQPEGGWTLEEPVGEK